MRLIMATWGRASVRAGRIRWTSASRKAIQLPVTTVSTIRKPVTLCTGLV